MEWQNNFVILKVDIGGHAAILLQNTLNTWKTHKPNNVIISIHRIVSSTIDYRIAININGGSNEFKYGVNI
jgi:hypothetical protein